MPREKALQSGELVYVAPAEAVTFMTAYSLWFTQRVDRGELGSVWKNRTLVLFLSQNFIGISFSH